MTHRRAGFTLVELLVVLVITAILSSAIGYAFTAELSTQRLSEARRAALDRNDATEQEITRLLRGAKVVPPVDDNTPAGSPTTEPDTPPGEGGPVAAPQQTTFFIGAAASGASDLGCNRLTFTTTAPAVPMAALGSTDDFQTQQQTRGPVGGLSEVSLGTAAVGNASARTGLFQRVQRPADADPTQGGFESVLAPEIARIGFEFWDGVAWVNDWQESDPPRLPAAVRVSYTLKGADESGQARVFIVPIPASDVDAQNPIDTESGQQ